MMRTLVRHLVPLAAVCGLVCAAPVAADIEWEISKTIDLKEKPQDMALSGDGSTAYILADGKVLVYSMREGKVTGDIPVKGKFSSISVAPKSGELFLADEAGKKITVVSISEVFNIPIGKSPAIGNKDAKVTLYAFLDYQ